MRNLVIVGPPGSGKSTMAKIIADAGRMVYVSSGNIAREMAKTDETTKHNLQKGMMAPEEEMRDRIYEILYDVTYKGKSFVLDGFPRDIEQYQWLRRRFPDIMYVMLDIDIRESMERLFNRGREDDKLFIINRRIGWYHDHTIPMLDAIGLIHKVDNSAKSISQILEWIEE